MVSKRTYLILQPILISCAASRKAIFHSDSKFSEQSRLITSLSAKQQKMILEGFTFHEDVRKTLDVQKQRDEAISWLGDGVETTDVVPPREQGTCLWIFEHPSFKRWVESEHAGCLWIHGIPGVGKSVLARTISETFEETASTNVVLTYFFKNAVNRTASQAPLFAASVLSQLCRSKVVEEHSQLCRVVEKVMAFRMRYNWVRSCPTDKILELLDTVLEVITECTFIVEGLDECTDFNETDDHLPRYLQRLGSRPNVTAIVLSRKYARFEKLFAKDSQLDMNHSVIEPDIMLYVKKEISRSSTLQPLASEITQKVVHCCDGMFLWTRLMLEYLKDARTVNVQKRRLSDFPPGLFSVYEQQIRETGAGLDEEGKILRRRVFLLLVGAVEPLSVHDVSTTMALDETSDLIDKNDEFLDPVREVLRLCWPLAMIVKERVYLVHMSVKEFLLLPRNPSSVQPNCLHMSLEDSNAFLAQKSLSKLSQSEYRSWRSSVTLLRKHLLTGGTIVSASQQDADPCVSTFADSVFYNYACLHWHEHVTALENPSDLIITKLSRFIIGNEFVTWSEVLFDLKNRIGLTPHVEVRSALKTWYKQRPSEIRERIPIGDYFEAPHNSLSHDFEARSQDKLLPYLPLIRLGEYFNLGAESRGDWQKAYEYLQAVVEGLQGLLGGRNPLTLRLRTSLLQQYFWQTRFDEAEQELLDVSGAQREFVGVDHPDLFITLQLLGLAQFYVNKFKASASTLEQSRKGLRQLLGPSNPRFLMTELYGGYALEAQARLDEAYERYQQILDVWEPITGPDNPLSLMASTAKGSVHRKRKQYVDAENAILNSFRARERLVGIGNNVCVDSAIQLAVLYREIRRGREAEEVLNVISASSIFPLDFHRDCQIVHLEALMRFDSGEYEKPRVTLQKLLERASGTNRDQNNRELLWVRIDLADVLCQHGENDQASMLFTDLVEPDNSPSASGNATPPPCAELASEPEPPTQLRIAEQALRYVRGSKPKAAERILAENRLRWVRRRDFWIMQGGPFTDTAWMSGPGHKPPPPSEGAILLESMSAS